MIARLLRTIRAFRVRPLLAAEPVDGWYVLPRGATDIRVADIENLPGQVVYYRMPTWTLRDRWEAAREAWKSK